jgi:hypothetical protein
MFTITAKQPVNWSWLGFKLKKGDNQFESRDDIKADVWPKLERFRELGILEFEGDVPTAAPTVTPSPQQLLAMNKDQLAELAKSVGVAVPDGAFKRDLLQLLGAKFGHAAPEIAPPTS